MTNSPLAAKRIERSNVLLPITLAAPGEVPRSLHVLPGDMVQLHITVMPKDVMLSWKGEVRRGGEVLARFSHSTLFGMLLCTEDLLRTSPEFVPRLDPWGKARMTLLSLCDGQRKLREIEQEVLRRHPDLFPSQSAAATFVASVVTRYTLTPDSTLQR